MNLLHLQLVIMEMKLYDPISNIDSTTYDWVCRVRVQSFWKGLNRETKEFWGINMVLIDDSVCLGYNI